MLMVYLHNLGLKGKRVVAILRYFLSTATFPEYGIPWGIKFCGMSSHVLYSLVEFESVPVKIDTCRIQIKPKPFFHKRTIGRRLILTVNMALHVGV